MRYNEYIKTHGLIDWPYPIRYGKQTELETDVLVMGGGIAGCWAAISAARRGLKVILFEKGATKKSGAGGSGCDHWLNTPHPGSPVTAEEVVEWELEMSNGYTNALSRYIAARESFETLLELEKMGGVIRDVRDEFKGAPFRDEETRFIFAYDYAGRIHFRVRGSTFKVSLHRECGKLGVRIMDRVMATGLLTEKGRQGARVVGGVGLQCRTGEIYVVKAKAVVNGLSRHQRNWSFSTELRGNANFRPTQIVGDGHALAWRAGAEFAMMEKSAATSFASGNVFQPYSVGNTLNTWVPCSIVDADGKEIPWVDRDGRQLSNVLERCMPAPGQKFMGERTLAYRHKRPELIQDLEERIRKGEYALPLYADMTSMPDYERRVIWGHMVGEEGKTRVPVYVYYTEAGFDPARDMLQCYMLLGSDPMRGNVRGQDRTGGEIGDAGGLVTDWNLMTNIEGFFAAGDALFGANYHYHAATTGRYAGRKAAEHAMKAGRPELDPDQVEAEKARVYAPLENECALEWKDINAAACRVMQNYCGEFKNEELLKIALIWLEDIRAHEATRVCTDTPHKLMRTLEVLNILTCDEIIVRSSMARKASSQSLGFNRIDHPQNDPAEWHKWVTLKQVDGEVKAGSMPLDFWKPLAENYEKHNRK
jgi:succinate dehydrogenase/fumarate reductase flavoprotein subunit